MFLCLQTKKKDCDSFVITLFIPEKLLTKMWSNLFCNQYYTASQVWRNSRKF